VGKGSIIGNLLGGESRRLPFSFRVRGKLMTGRRAQADLLVEWGKKEQLCSPTTWRGRGKGADEFRFGGCDERRGGAYFVHFVEETKGPMPEKRRTNFCFRKREGKFNLKIGLHSGHAFFALPRRGRTGNASSRGGRKKTKVQFRSPSPVKKS